VIVGVVSLLWNCRYWIDYYPEDFKGGLLLEQVSSLQKAMNEQHDQQLLSMLSTDSM